MLTLHKAIGWRSDTLYDASIVTTCLFQVNTFTLHEDVCARVCVCVCVLVSKKSEVSDVHCVYIRGVQGSMVSGHDVHACSVAKQPWFSCVSLHGIC